ncbi:MAG: NUDIX domain-containing protein [Pyrinomonadaceae bacterium]
MSVKKVCPVITRKKKARKEILVFRDPNGDVQLVKGNIKNGEKSKTAALRELKEESGIDSVSSAKLIGAWNAKYRKQVWYFYRCKISKKLSNSWDFYTLDGGGQTFSFFWFDIKEKPGEDWPPVFKRALKYLKKQI